MTRRLMWKRLYDFGGGLIQSPYEHDAGIDMVVAREYRLVTGVDTPLKIDMGCAIALPDDMAAIVVGRSSAVARGIMVVNTLIDPGFRGHIYAMVWLMCTKPRHCIDIHVGERIAQLLPLPCIGHSLRLVEVDELPPSDRGDKGWGSTGV